jgi:hypothetical protein
MNSDIFKKFLSAHVERAVVELGGLARVREIPHAEAIILGWICCCIHNTPSLAREWRNDDSPLGGILPSELRRAQDYIRLRIETESSTA